MLPQFVFVTLHDPRAKDELAERIRRELGVEAYAIEDKTGSSGYDFDIIVIVGPDHEIHLFLGQLGKLLYGFDATSNWRPTRPRT